jgi:hypothetical protein
MGGADRLELRGALRARLDRTPAVAPQLTAVRDQVVREWENERRQRARNDAYTKMRGEYQVSIETKLATERR